MFGMHRVDGILLRVLLCFPFFTCPILRFIGVRLSGSMFPN